MRQRLKRAGQLGHQVGMIQMPSAARTPAPLIVRASFGSWNSSRSGVRCHMSCVTIIIIFWDTVLGLVSRGSVINVAYHVQFLSVQWTNKDLLSVVALWHLFQPTTVRPSNCFYLILYSQRPFSLGEVDICQVEEEGRLRKRGVGQCRVSKRCKHAVGQIFLELAQDLGF